ncbi:hypothetical protein [Rufibacter immobilis]|uniref:hypothetical protein n=1 Tax=Rufibacter immobilis TaxID=1348778 RepID=UPI0035E8FBE8
MKSVSPEELMFNPGSGLIIPSEVIPFVPSLYKVFDFVKGDINKDRLGGYILILANPADFEELDNEEAKVLVYFLVRGKDNVLLVQQKHDQLVFADNIQSPSINSPTFEVDSKKGGFTITYHTQGYARSGVWEEAVAGFIYDKKRADWILESITTSGGENSPGYNDEREAIRAAEERGDTAFLRRVEEEGYPFLDMEAKPTESEEENQTRYTSKQFGLITLSKFEMGDWVYNLHEKHTP